MGFFGGKKEPVRRRNVRPVKKAAMPERVIKGKEPYPSGNRALQSESGMLAVAFSKFRKSGGNFTSFHVLVNDLLKLYASPSLAGDPNVAIYQQNDDIISIAELLVALQDEFSDDLELDDSETMKVTVNELAHRCGIEKQKSV